MSDDFEISSHGSIWLLVPISVAASQWVADHLPADTPMFGAAFAIEHRYVDDIVAGIQQDGLSI